MDWGIVCNLVSAKSLSLWYERERLGRGVPASLPPGRGVWLAVGSGIGVADPVVGVVTGAVPSWVSGATKSPGCIEPGCEVCLF